MALAQDYLAKNELGRRLKELMKDKIVINEKGKETCVTQEILAKAVGIKRQTLGTYINGWTSPDAATLESLADYFGVTVDSLLGRNDRKNDKEKVLLLECSEYTGLSFEAIKDLHIYPSRAYTISKLCLTNGDLLDYIGRYLFPKVERLSDEEDAFILEKNENGQYKKSYSISDMDGNPPLLVTSQGYIPIDRDLGNNALLIQILSTLIGIKNGQDETK